MGNGTPLGRVLGLGSAHKGAGHWTVQRLTAIGNLTLGVWLAVSLFVNDVSSYAGMQRWLASPLAAAPLALFAISMFTHIRGGLPEMIEDYVHDEPRKLACLLAVNFYCWGGLIFSLICIAKIALGGATHVGQ